MSDFDGSGVFPLGHPGHPMLVVVLGGAGVVLFVGSFGLYEFLLGFLEGLFGLWSSLEYLLDSFVGLGFGYEVFSIGL